jgi:hypothetical protein
MTRHTASTRAYVQSIRVPSRTPIHRGGHHGRSRRRIGGGTMTTSGELRRLLVVATLVGVGLIPIGLVSMAGAGAGAEFRPFRVHRP